MTFHVVLGAGPVARSIVAALRSRSIDKFGSMKMRNCVLFPNEGTPRMTLKTHSEARSTHLSSLHLRDPWSGVINCPTDDDFR